MIPHKVSFSDQRDILNDAIINGTERNKPGTNIHQMNIQCLTKISESSKHQFSDISWDYLNSLDELSFYRYSYYVKYHEYLDWSWSETISSHVVKKIISETVIGLFDKVTRVVVMANAPGVALEAHRDFAAHTLYQIPGTLSETALKPSQIEFYDHLPNFSGVNPRIHHNQEFMTLKIPLTEIPGDNGKPFFQKGEHREFYSVGNHMFFMNEIELHGTYAVPFWRGVVSIDGIFNQKVFNELHRIPVQQ